MWENAKKIYDYVDENDIDVEDLDIQLHAYVFPMTEELLATCKENQYRFYILNDGGALPDVIMSHPHYDFTYTDIDSVEWVTNCTEETGFSVGTCASAGFNFSIFSEKYLNDGTVVSYENVSFKAAVVIPVYDFRYGDYLIVQKQLGIFHVMDYEKEAGMINFTCLDNMRFLDKKAKKITDIVTVPIKTDSLIAAILLQVKLHGYNFSEAKPFQVNKVDHLKKLTYRTIMSYALEPVGAYAYADYIGEITSKCFYASNSPIVKIPYDNVMNDKSSGAGVKINGYEIQYGDILVASYSYGAGEEEIEVPVPLTIDNPLFVKKKQESLDDIGERLTSRMFGFNFKPYEVTTFLPNFYIEAGDFIEVEDKNGEIHKILVSQLTWKDNLEMEIVSACETESNEEVSDYDSDVNEAIQRNNTLTNYEEKIAELESKLNTNSSATSAIAYMYYTGLQFNKEIKQMVDSSYTDDSVDTTITRFEVINTIPTNVYDGEPVLLSYSGDEYYLKAVLSSDKKICYLYTNAKKIMLPENCRGMFYNFTKCNYLDLSMFDSRNVTSMRTMFSLFGSALQPNDGIYLNLGNNFYTNKVTTMLRMFYKVGLGVENGIEINLGGNFDSASLTECDGMFWHFLREYIRNDTVEYAADTTTVPDYLDGTWSHAYQVIIRAQCLDTENDNCEECDPKELLGSQYEYNGIGGNTDKVNSQFYAGLDNGDGTIDFYQYPVPTGQFLKKNVTYHMVDDLSPSNTPIEYDNRIGSTYVYHDNLVWLSDAMTNAPIFKNLRALYDYYLTGRIYDFDESVFNETYHPIDYGFDADGNVSEMRNLYFNPSGGLTENSVHPESVQVDKVTIDLGERFTLSTGMKITDMFNNATFFYVNSDTYDYVKNNHEKRADHILHMIKKSY